MTGRNFSRVFCLFIIALNVYAVAMMAIAGQPMNPNLVVLDAIIACFSMIEKFFITFILDQMDREEAEMAGEDD